MKPRNCGMEETKIVDWLLGHLPVWERDSVRKHVQECERCRDISEEWRLLLENAAAPRDAGTHAAFGEAAERQQEASAGGALHRAEQPSAASRPGAGRAMPGPWLRRRMFAQVVLRKLRLLLRPRRYWISAAFAMAAFALVWCLFATERQSPPITPASDREIIREMDIAMRPQTVKYALLPSPSAGEARGFAWVNKPEGELLILIEGLAPAEDQDYQAWFISGSDRSNVGLLRWSNGKAHLYYRGKAVESAENIAVSLEPKGGSYRPTGPDAVWGSLEADR